MPSIQWGRLIFALSLLAVTAFLVRQVILIPDPTGDTQHIIVGGMEIRRCFKTGQFFDCQIHSYFPLLQHIPAALFAFIRSGSKFIGRRLVELNLVCFLGTAIAGALTLRRRSMGAPVAWLLVLFGSPMLVHTRCGFAELLATFALALLVCGLLLERRPWELFAAALIFGISKETAPISATVLCAAIVYRNAGVPLRPDRRLLAAWGGSAAAFAVNTGFNLLRFHHASNDYYAQPILRVDTMDRYFDNFLAAWISPAGGIVWYWPLLTLLLIAAAGTAIANAKLRRPLVLPMLFLVLVAGGLSGWFGAFGWTAWGNRLLLCWMPALALVVLWDQPETLSNWLRTGLNPQATAVALGGMFGIVTLPQLFVAFEYGIMWDVFRARSECPKYPDIFTDVDGYYRCMHTYFWGWPAEWTLTRSYSVLASDWLFWGMSAIFVALFASGFALLAKRTSTEST